MDRSRLLVAAYGIGTLGVLLQIAGAHWDVSWHILGIVETFFTPPHGVLYSGIALTIIAAVIGLYLRSRSDSPLLTGLVFAAVGGGLQLLSGPLDFWWHSAYGFDPYLFTPTHSILIAGIVLGGVGMTLGASRLVSAPEVRALNGLAPPRSLLQLMVVVTLAVLWLDMNFFLEWLFNAQGIAYTFGICSPQVLALRACSFVDSFYTSTFFPAVTLYSITGTMTLFASKRLLGWKGAATAIGAVVIGTQALTDIGFPSLLLRAGTAPGSFYLAGSLPRLGDHLASGIPFYVALLAPIALFDFFVPRSNTRILLLASVLLGPISLYSNVSFPFFSGLWSIELALVPIFVAPMLIGGLIAGLTATRFAGKLVQVPRSVDSA